MRKHDIFTCENITVAMVTNKNRAFRCLLWNDLVFHWCLYNNITVHGLLEIRNFSSRVEKYFSTLKEKFHISACPCNILYIIFWWTVFIHNHYGLWHYNFLQILEWCIWTRTEMGSKDSGGIRTPGIYKVKFWFKNSKHVVSLIKLMLFKWTKMLFLWR